MPPKRKKEPDTRFLSGPSQARSTWPTSFLKRRESQEQLAKPGHYETKAAFRTGCGAKDEHVGPSSAMEDGEFGCRVQLLMFPNGTIRVMGALYPAEVEVDEETGEACGMTSVNDILLNGHVGVSRFGRSVLTTLQDGFIKGGSEQGERYAVPHKFRAELKVLQPGQTFRVEQCPHDAAQRAMYPARVEDEEDENREEGDEEDGDVADSEGMLKRTTEVGDLIVTFHVRDRYPVVHFMKRVHESPSDYSGTPVDDDDMEGDTLEGWFC